MLPGGADERLIRVLDVENDSPASIAGLVPMRDYLLGTAFVSFSSTDVLAKTLYESYEEVCMPPASVSQLPNGYLIEWCSGYSNN